MPTITAETDLDRLFNPGSIALVGASNSPGKMGNLFARRLVEGFDGRLYPVNPNSSEVLGIASVASVADLPEPVDVLIALVPGGDLMRVIESCRPGRVGFVIAVPSGFAEVDARGAVEQDRMLAIAAERHIRLVGPNCVGFMNGEIGLNASMIPLLPPKGMGVSCITQSGGFGMALAMYAADSGLPVSKFCDLGNMVDIEVEEMLVYLENDLATRAILLFLESVRLPESFLARLAAVARRKPLVMTGVGVSAAGTRASLAHLGLNPNYAAARDGSGGEAIIAETGIEALDMVKALSWQRPLTGRRAAILTGTGGIGGELTDLAVASGFEVPRFSDALRDDIAALLPDYAGSRNPVDLTPVWWQYPKLYPQIMRLIARSGEADVLIVSVTDVASTLPELAQGLIEVASNGGMLPTVVFWGSRDSDIELMQRIQAAHIPCYRTTRAAVRAASALLMRGVPVDRK